MDFFNPDTRFFIAKIRDCSRFPAMKPSPQPDRLGHLLSQARSGIGMENPMPRGPSNERTSRAHQDDPAFTKSPRGPHHAPPRERECDPPHPRCLPSMDHPKRGGSSAPPAVSSSATPLVPALWLSYVFPGSTTPRTARKSAASTGYHPKVVSCRFFRSRTKALERCAPLRPHRLLRSARSAA